MPHIYPETFTLPIGFEQMVDTDRRGILGEQRVYEALSEQLPEDWTVIYSFHPEFVGPMGEDLSFESDFVVLVPGAGLLMIEVKHWQWEQVSIEADGKWYRNGRPVEHDTPLGQAKRARKKMMRFLVMRHLISAPKDICFRELVVLVGCGNRALAAEDTGAYLFEGDYEDGGLCRAIHRVFAQRYPTSARMTPALAAAIAGSLRNREFYRCDLGNYEQVVDAASQPLLQLLPALEQSTGGIRVDGGAGCGKTYMAKSELLRQATRAAERGSGEHFLYVCFNRKLASAVRTDYELLPYTMGAGASVHVHAIHDLCSAILDEAGHPELHSAHNSMGEGAAAALENAIAAGVHARDYSAIFADEAQDISPAGWAAIRALQRRGNSKFYVLTDELQNLYRRGEPSLVPELPTRVHLTRNLRCSRQINAFCRETLPGDCNSLPLELTGQDIGAGSITGGCDDPAERARHIDRIIQQILNSHGATVSAADIIVLSPWRIDRPECSMRHLRQVVFADSPGADEDPALLPPDKVVGHTIKSFKGLESNFVIIADIDAPGAHHNYDYSDLYTACSRARYGLYFVPTVAGEPHLRTILENMRAALAEEL